MFDNYKVYDYVEGLSDSQKIALVEDFCKNVDISDLQSLWIPRIDTDISNVKWIMPNEKCPGEVLIRCVPRHFYTEKLKTKRFQISDILQALSMHYDKKYSKYYENKSTIDFNKIYESTHN